MASGFSSKIVITNPDELFGRKDLLNQLISLANNGNSVAIIGLRRFGKTSLLRCLETSLNSNLESKVYPIYFDFKEVGSIIKGTDNVFKYMISCFVAKLFNDGYFREESIFKKVLIKATGDWEDIYESLGDVNSVRIQGVFEDLILFFSEYLEKTILFLFDEYEWLFRFSFDQPVGFMKLRNFSSRQSNSGINTFSFWIAGATSWDYLCTITGSPELNVIDAPIIYVNQIDYESFLLMWQDEIKKTQHSPENLKNCYEYVYHASGGIPFYAKLIGSHILTSVNPANYTLLKPHFQELFEFLPTEEREILNDLAKQPRNFKNSKYLYELIDKGLIKKSGNNYEIRSTFFKEFLVFNLQSNNKQADNMPESQKLVDTISTMIMNINNTYKNKKGIYIFEPVVDDAALMKDLRTPCYSLELFGDFASSLYKIVFERTKDNKNGTDVSKAKLPNNFKKNNQFIEIIDIMRHSLGGGHLMDTFTQRPGQLSKVKMLEILVGSKNEPNTAEDFYNLQIATLKLFESELKKLNTIVRDLI